MSKNPIWLVLLTFLPASVFAATWTEECPPVEVSIPFQFGRIWTQDSSWSQKVYGGSNKPILMSCGNWLVMGQELACFYGAYKATYIYSIKKDIPTGAKCERSGECAFKCSAPTPPKKMAPETKVRKDLMIR